MGINNEYTHFCEFFPLEIEATLYLQELEQKYETLKKGANCSFLVTQSEEVTGIGNRFWYKNKEKLKNWWSARKYHLAYRLLR